MYLPSTGQWMQEDPKGFDAGDSNLRRYVENDPTNMTDPSGLAPNDISDFAGAKPVEKDSLKTPEVTFTNDNGEKGIGTIVMETGGTATAKDSGNTLSDVVRIGVTSDKALPSNTHWVQFVTNYFTDEKNELVKNCGSEVAGYAVTIKEGKVIFYKNGPTGTVVDSASLSSIYYDSKAARRILSGKVNEVSIFDRPRMNGEPEAATTTESYEFRTFLVIGGKPVYEIDWRYYRLKGKRKVDDTKNRNCERLSCHGVSS
jgi:uncharacterized protein RhaS with RHS repeats